MRFTKQLLAGLLASAMLPAAVPAFAAEGRTNIALGKSYTIESDAPNENSLGTTEEGGKDQLTDGAYGTSEYYSGLWAHFVNAYGRTVTIDLGASMSVDGVAMEFLQNKEHGVYCPRTLTVSLSENGTDFETSRHGRKAGFQHRQRPHPRALYGGFRKSARPLCPRAFRRAGQHLPR